MENFLRSLNFPTPEMLKDTIMKLKKECIVLGQLQSITNEEFEEIGVSLQAAQIIREGWQEFEKKVRNSNIHTSISD